MRSYSNANDYLGTKGDRPAPGDGRATRIIRRNEHSIAVRYQSTDVITYHADGRIVLDSGGWRTPTTKARIGEYAPGRGVSQQGGKWYFSDGSLFYDGVVLDLDGHPRTAQLETPAAMAHTRIIDRQVSDYIKRFAAVVAAGELGEPGAGDCFGCLMAPVEDKVPAAGAGGWGQTVRSTPHGRVEVFGVDHYLIHLEEAYFVPSLLANAIKARGYNNPGLIWHMTVTRKDGRMAADILRGYFRKLKPALYAAGAASGEAVMMAEGVR